MIDLAQQTGFRLVLKQSLKCVTTIQIWFGLKRFDASNSTFEHWFKISYSPDAPLDSPSQRWSAFER